MLQRLLLLLSVAALAAPTLATADDGPLRDDLAPYVAEPVALVSATADDDRTLSVVVDEGCPSSASRFARAVVEWADDRLTITALGDPLVPPTPGAAACPGGPQRSLTLALDRPLGLRAVYDGGYATPKLIAETPPPFRPATVGLTIVARPGHRPRMRTTTRTLRLAVQVTACGPTFVQAQVQYQRGRLWVAALGQTHPRTGGACPSAVRNMPIVVRLPHALAHRSVWTGPADAGRKLFAAPR